MLHMIFWKIDTITPTAAIVKIRGFRKYTGKSILQVKAKLIIKHL